MVHPFSRPHRLATGRKGPSTRLVRSRFGWVEASLLTITGKLSTDMPADKRSRTNRAEKLLGATANSFGDLEKACSSIVYRWVPACGWLAKSLELGDRRQPFGLFKDRNRLDAAGGRRMSCRRVLGRSCSCGRRPTV